MSVCRALGYVQTVTVRHECRFPCVMAADFLSCACRKGKVFSALHNDMFSAKNGGQRHSFGATSFFLFFFFFFFCVPQLYLWGSPLLGEIFAYVTVF